MKFFARKRTQRVTNFALAALLVVSTLTASVPFLFSEKAAAASNAVYAGLPASQPATYPSIGFAATSSKELGDRVTLAGSNRHLDDVTISLTTWACQNGEWNLNNCVTTPGATFQQPVTVNLYNVNSDGTVGSVIATKTQTIAAQYRPSADNDNCTGVNAGKWFNAANATCYNGKAFDVNFDFFSQHKTLPNDVIATVAYDGNASAGAKALNVSLATTAPTIGTDFNTDMYEDTTYLGTPAGLRASDYAGYHGAFNITASPTNVGPTATFNAPTPANGYVHGTIDTNTTFADDYGMGGYTVRFWKDAYEVAGGGTLVKDCSSFPGAYLLGTSQNVSCSLDVSAYPNGTKFFLSAQVMDGDNVWGNAVTRTYTVDNTKPTLYVKSGSSLVDPATTSGVFHDVSFKVYDNTLVDKVTINGVVKDLSDAQWSDVNGVTNGVFGAAEGSNTIVVYDVAGNTTSYTFVIDTTAPTGVLSYSPTALTNSSVTVTLTTDEPIQQSALPGTWLKVSDTVYKKVYPINTTQLVTLKDLVGNTSTVNVVITNIDKTLPTGSVSYSPSSLTNGDVVATLTTSEEIQLSTLPSGWTKENNTTYKKTFTANAFEVLNFKDLAGNSGTSAVSITWIDKEAPAAPAIHVEVNGVVLSDGDSTNSYNFDQVWNTPAGNPVKYQYKYWNDIAGNPFKEGSAYYDVTTNATLPGEFNQGQGTHYIQVRAYDEAGNVSDWSDVFSVVYDITPPVVTISSPADNTATGNNETVSINGSIGDSVSYTIKTGSTVLEDGASFDGTYDFDTTGFATGTYVITLTGTDAAGNSSSDNVTIVVDNTAPTVAITVPTTALVATATPTITGTYDNNQSLATDDTTILLFIDGSSTGVAVNKGVSTWSYTPTTPLSEGSHTFVAVATDTVGNVSSDSNTLTLTVDTTAPAVTVVSVSGTGNSTPVFSGTAELGAILSVTFNGVTTAVENAAGNWTFTSPTTLANGTYAFSITGTDAAGNTQTTTSSVVVAVVATPAITGPASAVLGANTDNTDNDNGAADVKGATDNKAAAAVNSDANQGKIFGLAWYWWLLILAALAAIAWFIVAAIRRRNEANS